MCGPECTLHWIIVECVCNIIYKKTVVHTCIYVIYVCYNNIGSIFFATWYTSEGTVSSLQSFMCTYATL